MYMFMYIHTYIHYSCICIYINYMYTHIYLCILNAAPRFRTILHEGEIDKRCAQSMIDVFTSSPMFQR